MKSHTVVQTGLLIMYTFTSFCITSGKSDIYKSKLHKDIVRDNEKIISNQIYSYKNIKTTLDIYIFTTSMIEKSKV